VLRPTEWGLRRLAAMQLHKDHLLLAYHQADITSFMSAYLARLTEAVNPADADEGEAVFQGFTDN
jgi:hypothetical protein